MTTDTHSFISELKRRNVFRAGAAYVVLAWLVVQVADVILDAFEAPSWLMRGVIITLAVGFPITLFVAWAFELTREGLKRTAEVELEDSITFQTGRKLDLAIIGVLVIALSWFALDKFVWQTSEGADRNSLAVMPFEIISDDVAPFFAQLSGDLARLVKRSAQVRLASDDAVLALPDVGDIIGSSARLGVHYLITGTIDATTSGVGLQVSMFDGKTGEQVWQRDFDNAHSQTTLNNVASELVAAIDGDPFALPEVASDPKAYELYLQARRQRTTSDAGAEAEELYRRSIEVDARFAPSLAGLCEILVSRYRSNSSQSDYEEAERYCHRAWTFDPHAAEVQRALGNLYQESGLLERAREAFAASLSISPGDLLTQVAMASTYHEDDPARAEAQLQSIIKLHPGSPYAYTNLQNLYFKQGRYHEATTYARLAVELDPEDRRAVSNLTADLILSGEFAEARPILEKAVERNKLVFGADQNNLAAVMFFEGDYSGAAELYELAVQVAPEDPMYRRGLGDAVYYRDGREAAVPIFETAIELATAQLAINPDNYDAPTTLLVGYASIGDKDGHLEIQGRVVAERSGDPQALYDLAVAASRIGDMNAARDFAVQASDGGYPKALLVADPDIRASGVSFPSH
mgnify:CR=1 FL=1